MKFNLVNFNFFGYKETQHFLDCDFFSGIKAENHIKTSRTCKQKNHLYIFLKIDFVNFSAEVFCKMFL